MSSWTAASSDCSRPVNNYVHVKTADLYRPNARLTPERQGYQVLTPFGKLGYSQGLNPNLYYRWSKEFLEAGKKRLLGDTTREATSTEVADVRKDVAELKQVVAELVLENRLLKKSVTGFDSEAGT